MNVGVLVAAEVMSAIGREPVSTLQSWLYTPGDPRWWDYYAMVIYAMHFALPCIFAFLLWVTRKERFWQFTIALCLLTYSAFAFFLLYPAAPPWLANTWGVVDGIGWPASSVTSSIGFNPIRDLDTVSIWQNASPHPVAAMPSFFSLTRNARSTEEPKALIATFLPLRSREDLIGESSRTKKVFWA